MSWQDEGFEHVGDRTGSVQLSVMGVDQELPINARLHLNAAGTIGAAEAETPEGHRWLLISLIGGKRHLTMGGVRDDRVELDDVVMTTVKDETPERLLAAHRDAGEPDADRDALAALLPDAPKLAAETSMRIMAQLMQSLRS